MSSFEIDSSREVAASSTPLSDRGDGPVPVCHSPSGAGPSAIAWHEASHAIVAKHYGMPVSVVTTVAGRWFAGRCLGPGTMLEDSPEAIFAACEARCKQARALMPPIGESDLAVGPWFAEVRARVCECLAGFQGEALAGFDPEGETISSDLEIATLYASSICSRIAAAAYLDYCKLEARAILECHWHAVAAVAQALETAKTLDGDAVDRLIEGAEFEVSHAAELARRARWKEISVRAAVFENSQRQLDTHGDEQEI